MHFLSRAYTFLCAQQWDPSIFALLGDEFDTEKSSFAHASGEFVGLVFYFVLFCFFTQRNLLLCCYLPLGRACRLQTVSSIFHDIF